jgi:hypothetical protein
MSIKRGYEYAFPQRGKEDDPHDCDKEPQFRKERHIQIGGEVF